MSTGTSCHFGHLLLVSKKCLWSLILFFLFFFFIHVYSPRAGADSPQGTTFWFQQKCLITSFICCKLKKKSLKSDFIHFFFHDLIHVYSPGAGVDSPQGTKFWCQLKGLITLPISCTFQRNLFEVWLYTILSRFNTCTYPQGSGHIGPRGQIFDVNWNFLSLRSSIASFKS